MSFEPLKPPPSAIGGAGDLPAVLARVMEGALPVVAAGIAIVLLFLLASAFGPSRGSRRRRPRLRVVGAGRDRAGRSPAPDDAPFSDPARQMAAIQRVDWARRPLLNRPESALFRLVENVVAELPDHRVMAQTSLGEVLRVEARGADRRLAREAHASINSKRLDIAIIGPDGLLALAIEYQGRGHHRDGAFMRDAVKREALRRAGVAMLEVEAGADPAIVRARLAEALSLSRPAGAGGATDASAHGRGLQPSG